MAAVEVLAFQEGWPASDAYGLSTAPHTTRTIGLDEDLGGLGSTAALATKLRLALIAKVWVDLCRQVSTTYADRRLPVPWRLQVPVVAQWIVPTVAQTLCLDSDTQAANAGDDG